MKRVRTLLMTAASLLAFTGAGLAADFPQKAAPIVYPPTPTYSWSGFYLGINGGWGYGGGDSDTVDGGGPMTITGYNVTGSVNGTCFWCNGPHTLGTPVTAGNWLVPGQFNNSGNGGEFGGQIGYNYQFNPFVLGVEADFNWSGVKGSETLTGAPPFSFNVPGFTGNNVNYFNNGVASTTSQLDWFSTVRARLGWLIRPDLLLYGTGGVAFGQVEGSTNIANSVGVTTTGGFAGQATFMQSGSVSDTKVGWSAGAGAEYAIGNGWSVKAEWIHVDLGDETYALPVTQSVTRTGIFNPAHQYNYSTAPVAAGSATQSFIYDFYRLGLNYKF